LSLLIGNEVVGGSGRGKGTDPGGDSIPDTGLLGQILEASSERCSDSSELWMPPDVPLYSGAADSGFPTLEVSVLRQGPVQGTKGGTADGIDCEASLAVGDHINRELQCNYMLCIALSIHPVIPIPDTIPDPRVEFERSHRCVINS